MQTKYYVTTPAIIEANSEFLGQSASLDIDGTLRIVAIFSANQPYWDTLAGVESLPDALRNSVLPLALANKLAPLGVLPTHTTFDVVDILAKRSKDFAFVLK